MTPSLPPSSLDGLIGSEGFAEISDHEIQGGLDRLGRIEGDLIDRIEERLASNWAPTPHARLLPDRPVRRSAGHAPVGRGEVRIVGLRGQR